MQVWHLYTGCKEVEASSNSKAEWAESCSARLQLCSVFSQSHLIVPNLLSIQFNSLDAFHLSTALVLLRLLPIPIRQINSKQRCCILLVTRCQLVSSGLLVKLLVSGIPNLSKNATLSTLFQRFSFPSRRRFKSTGCMASSRWLSTCTCKRLTDQTVTLWLWVSLSFHLQRGPYRFKKTPGTSTMRSSLMRVSNSLHHQMRSTCCYFPKHLPLSPIITSS